MRQLAAKAKSSGGACTVAGTLTGQAFVELKKDLPKTGVRLFWAFSALWAVTHHKHMSPVWNIVEFPDVTKTRFGEGALRCQVVHSSARHHERHPWIRPGCFCNPLYGARPKSPAHCRVLTDHDVDINHACRNLCEAGNIQFLTRGVLPHHHPDGTSFHFDDGPTGAIARWLAQQKEIGIGITPGAAYMIRMQPLLNERQIIPRDLSKTQIHVDFPLPAVKSPHVQAICFPTLARSNGPMDIRRPAPVNG